jgi:hypothetical protein
MPKGTANAAARISAVGLPLPNGAHWYIANAPAPANVIWANDTCPAQPVSGTSESISVPTTIASVIRLRFTWPMSREMNHTTPNRTTMPAAVSESRGTRGWCSFGFGASRRSSIRACGSARRARNRKIVGIANWTVLNRPDRSRKLIENVRMSPRRIPPT